MSYMKVPEVGTGYLSRSDTIGGPEWLNYSVVLVSGTSRLGVQCGHLFSVDRSG